MHGLKERNAPTLPTVFHYVLVDLFHLDVSKFLYRVFGSLVSHKLRIDNQFETTKNR